MPKTPSLRTESFLELIAATMENDAGQIVDLYVPRKCSATNRPIGARDHAAVQINVVEVC